MYVARIFLTARHKDQLFSTQLHRVRRSHLLSATIKLLLGHGTSNVCQQRNITMIQTSTNQIGMHPTHLPRVFLVGTVDDAERLRGVKFTGDCGNAAGARHAGNNFASAHSTSNRMLPANSLMIRNECASVRRTLLTIFDVEPLERDHSSTRKCGPRTNNNVTLTNGIRALSSMTEANNGLSIMVSGRCSTKINPWRALM